MAKRTLNYGGVGQVTRYSGRWKIRCSYRDRWNDYECIFSPPAGMRPGAVKAARFAIPVGAPAYLTQAVDSPTAFDDAVRAAISFAIAGGKVYDHEVDWGDSGPIVRRKR